MLVNKDKVIEYITEVNNIFHIKLYDNYNFIVTNELGKIKIQKKYNMYNYVKNKDLYFFKDIILKLKYPIENDIIFMTNLIIVNKSVYRKLRSNLDKMLINVREVYQI